MKEAQHLLSEAEHRWHEISQHGSVRSGSLLKLAVLRELARAIHRGTSDNLADRSVTQAEELISLENKLDDLRSREMPADQNLGAFLKDPSLAGRSTRTVPDCFFRVFPKAKFERNDRFWEMALLAEGVRCGWRLWRLDAALPLDEVEAWNQHLTEKLWPNGICLFAEAGQSAKSLSDWDQKVWHGRWYCLLERKYKKARQIQLPLLTTSPTHSMSWRLIFSAPFL